VKQLASKVQFAKLAALTHGPEEEKKEAPLPTIAAIMTPHFLFSFH